MAPALSKQTVISSALYLTFFVNFTSAQPSETSPPLIEKKWIESERENAKGFFHKWSTLLSKPVTVRQQKDSNGRIFEINGSDTVSYHPEEGNWRPVTPNTKDVPYYLAEAEVLRKKGMLLDSLRILKAIRAMGRDPSEISEMKNYSQKATEAINHYEETLSEFSAINADADPFIYYNHKMERSILQGEDMGIFISLPKEWRFFRSITPGRKGEKIKVVHLENKPFTLTIGMEYLKTGKSIRSLNEFVYTWDRRRNLIEMQKEFCPGGKKQNIAPAVPSSRKKNSQNFCTLLDSKFDVREKTGIDPLVHKFENETEPPPEYMQKKIRSFEYYQLFSNRGLYVELRYEDEAVSEDSVNQILKEILNGIQFKRL